MNSSNSVKRYIFFTVEKPEFLWSQSSEDVSIWFNLPETSNKRDVSVDIRPKSILVQFKNQTMLEGSLFNTVKAEECTWTLESGK